MTQLEHPFTRLVETAGLPPGDALGKEPIPVAVLFTHAAILTWTGTRAAVCSPITIESGRKTLPGA